MMPLWSEKPKKIDTSVDAIPVVGLAGNPVVTIKVLECISWPTRKQYVSTFSQLV